jgi:acetyl-CoA acetyltransferase
VSRRSDLSGKTAIVGVGYSEIGRRVPRTLGLLARDAALAAIADAGLEPSDIDGLSSYPKNPVVGTAEGFDDGLDIVTVDYMIRALQLQDRVRWFNHSGHAMVGAALIEAINAVAAGACDHALVYRAVHVPVGRYSTWSESTASGVLQYHVPYGHIAGALRLAMDTQKYMRRSGATREDLGRYVVRNRGHAALNDHAYWRGKPLTLDDYMTSRIIADPICIHDCDIPVDGCAALVITHADRARELGRAHAYILGYALSPLPGNWWGDAANVDLLFDTGASLGKTLWSSSGVSPKDMQAAMLYDGYSPLVAWWSEALGFCERGEGLQFTQDSRTDIGGELPLNPNGGSLGEGRLHGMAQLTEAFYQVTERAGERQVANIEHAVATVGPLSGSSGFVLSKYPGS